MTADFVEQVMSFLLESQRLLTMQQRNHGIVIYKALKKDLPLFIAAQFIVYFGITTEESLTPHIDDITSKDPSFIWATNAPQIFVESFVSTNISAKFAIQVKKFKVLVNVVVYRKIVSN